MLNYGSYSYTVFGQAVPCLTKSLRRCGGTVQATYRSVNVFQKVVVQRAERCVRRQAAVMLYHRRIHSAEQRRRPKRQRQLRSCKATTIADP